MDLIVNVIFASIKKTIVLNSTQIILALLTINLESKEDPGMYGLEDGLCDKIDKKP